MNIALTAGVDPYDALRGSRIPSIVREHARLRQAIIQLRKRSPIDLAALCGVRPFIMAKALGCFLAAEARGGMVKAEGAEGRAVAIAHALDRNEGTMLPGAWGYEFDVQTRWAFYSAGEPNLIATVFVGRGFLEAGLAFDREDWIAKAVASGRYLTERHLSTSGGRCFFRYTQDSERLVHNANLLGAGYVSALGRLVGLSELLEAGASAAATSVAAVSSDGGLPYGEGAGLAWDDNFHTAYDLDGLSWVSLAVDDLGIEKVLSACSQSWARDFFGSMGEPHYYRSRRYPYDIHAAATAVDVGSRLASRGIDTGVEQRTAAWTMGHLVDPQSGLTYYQVHRGFTDKRNFRRWGDAHWALATSALLAKERGIKAPVEQALMKGRHGRV